MKGTPPFMPWCDPHLQHLVEGTHSLRVDTGWLTLLSSNTTNGTQESFLPGVLPIPLPGQSLDKFSRSDITDPA